MFTGFPSDTVSEASLPFQPDSIIFSSKSINCIIKNKITFLWRMSWQTGKEHFKLNRDKDEIEDHVSLFSFTQEDLNNGRCFLCFMFNAPFKKCPDSQLICRAAVALNIEKLQVSMLSTQKIREKITTLSINKKRGYRKQKADHWALHYKNADDDHDPDLLLVFRQCSELNPINQDEQFTNSILKSRTSIING